MSNETQKHTRAADIMGYKNYLYGYTVRALSERGSKYLNGDTFQMEFEEFKKMAVCAKSSGLIVRKDR